MSNNMRYIIISMTLIVGSRRLAGRPHGRPDPRAAAELVEVVHPAGHNIMCMYMYIYIYIYCACVYINIYIYIYTYI